MREIKFRAWDKENKAFMPNEGYAICDGDVMGLRYGNEMEDVLTDQVEIMQYTGLKDVNGKDIYEGDIVVVVSQYWGQLGNRYEVKFRKGVFTTKYDLLSGISPSTSVIGNIHENPELLEAE